MQIVEEINSTPEDGQRETERAPEKMKLFCSTVIRFAEGGKVWLMNRQDGGWNRSGYCHNSLPSVFKAWDIVPGEFGQDEHSYFLRVSPATDER